MAKVQSNISGVSSLATLTGAAARYLPEPATKGVGLFRDLLRVAGQFGNTVVGGVDAAASGDFADLIGVQIEIQKELQTTTMVSNIEKSRHESKMSAIRNIRVN